MKTLNLKKAFALAAPLALMVVSYAAQANAATYAPVWSAKSYASAEAACAKEDGKTVGHKMETVTADGNQFYITVCERPTDGGESYTIAWSAIGDDDAQARCEYPSVTTGLPAGHAVGPVRSAEAPSDDIFVIVCRRN